ncbi:hypothetical protein BDL97_17G036400 [Sphagnum fallax]|nr:hypothetical protein BDL97_17G036400 [Sphagnum fallax]
MQVSSFCHSSSLAFNLVQNLLLPSWDLWPQDCWRQQAGHSVMRKCSAILSVVSSLQILNLPGTSTKKESYQHHFVHAVSPNQR